MEKKSYIQPNVLRKGQYIHNFELVLAPRLPETVTHQYASVSYRLEAVIKLAGIFGYKAAHSEEITIVNRREDMSLEYSTPIILSREWKDQISCQISIGGRAAPLNGSIPMIISLVPATKANIRCLDLKLFLCETAFRHEISGVPYSCARRCELLCHGTGNASMSSTTTPARNARFPNKEFGHIPTSTYYHPKSNPDRWDQQIAGLDQLLQRSCEVSTELNLNIPMPTCGAHKHNNQTASQPAPMHSDVDQMGFQVKHWLKVSSLSEHWGKLTD